MDKKTFSLKDNISQSGGSVLQAMQNLPSVTVQDGKVQLRGNDKVTVLIAVKLKASEWEKVTGDVQIGDKVMYYKNNSGNLVWMHSAVVTEVDLEGYATKVSSKMGTYEIITHHPRDIPVSYGATAPTFEIEEKIVPSRIYWRKK